MGESGGWERVIDGRVIDREIDRQRVIGRESDILERVIHGI